MTGILKISIKVTGLLLLVAMLQYISLLEAPRFHDMIKYLYFLPIMLAAYRLGWKGGIVFAVIASTISSLHLILHSNTYYPEYALQMVTFVLGGGVLGLLSDKDREKRRLIEQSKIDFLRALSQSLDARDTYTEGHSLRVAAIALEIGKSAGITGRELDDLYQAGLMHDIGKIGISNEILRKESPLDPAEYAAIKRHPAIGGDILSHVHLLHKLPSIVRHHHEKYDGTGYPDQLSGEQIPYMARIISIADALDAMTSQRTYNRRKSIQEAAAEIEKMAGTQFDPRLIGPLKESLGRLKETGINQLFPVSRPPVVSNSEEFFASKRRSLIMNGL